MSWLDGRKGFKDWFMEVAGRDYNNRNDTDYLIKQAYDEGYKKGYDYASESFVEDDEMNSLHQIDLEDDVHDDY